MASQMIKKLKSKTLMNPQIPQMNLTQTRNFARWVPYKPSPKPKLHQNLLTIATLKTHLLDSYLVSPFPCHGFSANRFKPLKSPIGSGTAKLIVVKNSIAAEALRGTQWEKLGQCLKGMNSLLFVKREQDVGPALAEVKAKVKEGKMEFNEFSGAVVTGGEVYGHLDLMILEKAPSRVEANAAVLQCVFGPSSTLMAVLEGFGGSDDDKDCEGSVGENVEESVA